MVPLAAIQAVPIAVIAWYRLHRYAWYRYSAIVNLEIDTPMFSKIERGDRRAKRSQVLQLAKFFHIDEKELLILWLADRILDAIEGEKELQLYAIEVVECELAKADL